jgi:hypothetical protein
MSAAITNAHTARRSRPTSLTISGTKPSYATTTAPSYMNAAPEMTAINPTQRG